MIVINNISINNTGSNLNINISTGSTYIITSIKLWTEDSFKDYTKAKDLNYKLEQINNNEIFNVSASELGLSNFNGIYFIEIESNEINTDECSTCNNPVLAIITNLTQYYRCMTELILEADLCNINLFSKEVCDDNLINKAMTISLLIDGINQCLELGQFIEAIEMLKNIKKLCNNCKNCKTINKSSGCTTCNNNYIYQL